MLIYMPLNTLLLNATQIWSRSEQIAPAVLARRNVTERTKTGLLRRPSSSRINTRSTAEALVFVASVIARLLTSYSVLILLLARLRLSVCVSEY